jgi:hypothetical protein
VQGECAVYRRVLRQLGEVYAAKQRLGVDPELEIPFTIEGAIEVYAKLALAGDDGWQDLGFRATGRESYVTAMRGLWEEIQETILNAAAYYLARSQEVPTRRTRTRATRRACTALPVVLRALRDRGARGGVDSACFAATRPPGRGDAYLVYATRACRTR